jgi:hypothetical protein
MDDKPFLNNLDIFFENKFVENIFLCAGSFFIGAGVILLFIDNNNTCHC